MCGLQYELALTHESICRESFLTINLRFRSPNSDSELLAAIALVLSAFYTKSHLLDLISSNLVRVRLANFDAEAKFAIPR